MRNSSLIGTLLTVGLFIALEVLSIVMITNNSIVQKYKFMGTVRGFQSFFWKASENTDSFFHLRGENDLLIEENLRLRQELDLYKARAEAMDDTVSWTEAGYTYIPATVIKNSTNKQHNYLVLNRGEEHGIHEGMGVMTDCGVVGIVDAVNRRYSYVISLLDVGQSVSAKIAKNNSFGPMAWNGISPRKAILNEIPVHTETELGDTVSTSGYSAIFPPDIPLGSITDVSIVNGVTKRLEIELFQDFKSLRNVYVVGNNHYHEITEVEKK